MSSEQITQETVPVEKTETSTLGKILLVKSLEKTQT
jgi:hypothetical protein